MAGGPGGHVFLRAPFLLLPSSFRVASYLCTRNPCPRGELTPESLMVSPARGDCFRGHVSWGGQWAGPGLSCRGRSSAGMLGATADDPPPWGHLARGRPTPVYTELGGPQNFRACTQTRECPGEGPPPLEMADIKPREEQPPPLASRKPTGRFSRTSLSVRLRSPGL